MTRQQVQRQLEQIFRWYLGIGATGTQTLVPPTITAGKLYEAHVLSRVVEHLAVDEQYQLTLVGGSIRVLPGP